MNRDHRRLQRIILTRHGSRRVPANPLNTLIGHNALAPITMDKMNKTVSVVPVLHAILPLEVFQSGLVDPILHSIRTNVMVKAIQAYPILHVVHSAKMRQTVISYPILNTVLPRPVLSSILSDPVFRPVFVEKVIWILRPH